jgi:hypothetical protein
MDQIIKRMYEINRLRIETPISLFGFVKRTDDRVLLC